MAEATIPFRSTAIEDLPAPERDADEETRATAALTARGLAMLREPAAEGERDGFDAVREIIDSFASPAAFLREGARVFDNAQARLGVALHRATLRLDEEVAREPEPAL